MPITRRRFLGQTGLMTLAAGACTVPAAHVFGAAANPARVRIGMIGTAHPHAAGKLEALRRMTDLFDVVGWAEPDPSLQSRAAAQAEFRGLPMMSEEQVLNIPGLMAVLVEPAVPDELAIANRVAKAGVHIHLEKPGSSSLPAFIRLQQRMADQHRILQLGYMLRRSPGVELCIRAAKEGWLGDIHEVTAVMGKRITDPAERKGLAQYSGGIMFELGGHPIDATLLMLGKPRDVHSYLRKSRAPQDDLVDTALAVLEYPSAIASITTTADDADGGRRRSFAVSGTLGTITAWPMESGKLTLNLVKPAGSYQAGSQSITLPPSPGRYDGLLADFGRAILGQSPPDTTPEHDRHVLETLLRASGMPID